MRAEGLQPTRLLASSANVKSRPKNCERVNGGLAPHAAAWTTQISDWRILLHCDFGLEAFEVTKDRGDGQHAPVAFHAQQAVLGSDIAVDGDLIPFRGMADIVDRNIIVLAPEEGHRAEFLPMPEHVDGRGLRLALRNHPMLDTDALAAVRIGPSRNVPGRKDARSACFEE